MSTWHGLSRHHHSGRLRPHRHTSYAPLGLLLVTVGVILGVCTASAASPGPEGGSIGITGTMPGKPPTKGATISSPRQQQRFTTSPVTIEGTCPAGLLVEVYKNDIFAGSALCTKNDTFKLEVDLLIGENKLVARVYDDLNQPGPDSQTVTVFYDFLLSQGDPLASLNLGGTQMLLVTDAVFRGTFPGEQLSVPVTILGGVPPYALNTIWGDSSNKVVPRNDNLIFNVGHTYAKAGTYQITLQATDSQGRVAFLTVAAIINGHREVAAGTASPPPKVNRIFVLWPLYVCLVAVVIAFWLGERREKHVLAGRMA